MRLSEIGDKEIVDLANGSLHGKLWDAEILFDEFTGQIHTLTVPQLTNIRDCRNMNLNLAWRSILIIGEDAIIFRSR